jgi:uncharacterized protein (TIGR02217 family)
MFNETRLLDSVSYGSEFGNEFNTRTIGLRSGHERRNINWTVPLGRYSINYSALLPEHHLLVYHAHMACFGSAIAFRFKDWTDFQAISEPIGIGTGASQDLQLVKTYSFGPLDLVRNITKPVVATIYEDDVEIASSVDTTTGIVTFTATVDSVITWSGEFDVPVKFDDDRLDFQPSNRSGSRMILSSNVTLSEVRL